MKKTSFIIITLVLLIILESIISFDFEGISLSPNNPTTSDDLICTWNVTGSTDQVNVTWYNNSILHKHKEGVSGNSDILSSTSTKRGQNWNCTVSMTNSSYSEKQSILKTILNADPDPPSISNQTLEEDIDWSHTLTSTDADEDNVGFFCLPDNRFFPCEVDGSLSWTPEYTDEGTYNLTFYAYDDFTPQGISATTVTFNITTTNDMPEFSDAIENQTIDENQTLQYDITMIDEENNSGPFNFSIISNFNPERIEYNTSDNKTFTIQFVGNDRSEPGDVGVWQINITAWDPVNGSMTINGSFYLNVSPINHAPELYLIQNETSNQTSLFSLWVNASDYDSGDSLSFSILPQNCTVSNPWNITTINSSRNATGFINMTLDNNHVVCRDIIVSVTDGLSSGSQAVYLNLTNANDDPIIYNYSYYGNNNPYNVDIRNLTAYTGSQFTYMINGTDLDSLTYEDEILTYGDNSSSCVTCPKLTLNTSSGVVKFMPNTSFIGNFTYEVNVTDDEFAYAIQTMTINIINNTAPYFDPDLLNKSVNESDLFTYDINASDFQNDTITYTDNSALFTINSSTGLINFTPNCAYIANYSITITITDAIGAYNEDNFTLEIINEPNAPVLPVFYNTTLLEEKSYTFNLGTSTTDGDVDCGLSDTLNYSSEFKFGNTLFNIDPGTGEIVLPLNSSSSGNYLVYINVTDTYNLTDFLYWNFTIVNRTEPPVINNVTPFGYPTNFSWTNLTNLGANLTTINLTENVTIKFDHNSTDPDNDPLFFNWSVDGITQSTLDKNLTYYWDFSSSGLHKVVLTVSDNVSGTLDNYVNFTWNVTIDSINRPPVLNESLPNVTVNGTLALGNYLTGVGWSYTGFYDPDGDALTYTYTNASIVGISITGDTVTFTGQSLGLDSTIFTASDGEFVVQSNNISLNVTEVYVGETITETRTETRRSTDTIVVPYSVIEEVEVEKEIYFDIIIPEPITVYRNNTLRETIRLVNNGDQILKGITLSAEVNETNADIFFSKSYIPQLQPGEETQTELVITAYKLLNNYEIILWANVTEPAYNDKVVIYVNAIEKTRGNQSVASTKITFARDLLNSNPECIELNEFLKKAQNAMDQGDYLQSSEIMDSVIQGCKYLVSQSKLRDERPLGFLINLDLDRTPFLKPALIMFGVLMIAAILLSVKAKKANQEEGSDD